MAEVTKIVGCTKHPAWLGLTEFCPFCHRERVMRKEKYDPRMSLTLKDMPSYGKTNKVTIATGGNH